MSSSFMSRVAALLAACVLMVVGLPAHAEAPSGVVNINQASAG